MDYVIVVQCKFMNVFESAKDNLEVHDKMNLPKKIIRLDDGMEFLLTESFRYRIHLGIPHLDDSKHIHNEYSYEQLMSCPDKFKVSDGTEDIQAMKRNWLKQFEGRNDGHGNEE